MRLVVNGGEVAVRKGITLRELVRELHLDGSPIAVELNLKVVPKDRYAETRLAEGDGVEIVTLTGGG